nr:inositol hexakisphosphate and diphosphoinositol-pentakisphosphate kinase-like isoform X11 [Cherax quadricarinatus]
MILRELAPTFHIPWAIPFQLDDPPIVPTTFGKMMELRCVVAVIRHGDRTPKQKMKMEVRHPKFFALFAKYDGYKDGHVKLKKPKQLQEVLDIARGLLAEIEQKRADPETEEKKGKLEQLKSVLEIFLKDLRLQEEQLCCLTYGHFSGINRKVQLKYQPRGWKRRSSSEEGDSPREPSLVLILKWGGELTPAGRAQAEEFGRMFRCMYPGGQVVNVTEPSCSVQGEKSSGFSLEGHNHQNIICIPQQLTGERTEWIDESVTGCEYAGTQGLGLLRLHSTYRHDLKIYASDEGRVQMTAAAFAKGLLALEGELTPILVQMVKSANTNGLLDNDCDSYKHQNMVKNHLHEAMQQDRILTKEDMEKLNPTNSRSIKTALEFIQNPVKMCEHVNALIKKLNERIKIRKEDQKTKELPLYHGESWELMQRRWAKLEKDFRTKNTKFDISKIPDIYDCIKYDLQHNNHTLQFEHAEELYKCAKYLADVVIPQEYGMTPQEKMAIGQGICTPLLKKIRADLQRNIEESEENAGESINRLNPIYSHGVSSPSRHVRTRLYFTSESHIHSLLTVLRFGGLIDNPKDEQWNRAMDYIGAVSELNYLSQIVIMLYEDPTKDPSSDSRFHVELHFSPGVNCCVHKNLPPGPGFRPKSRNEPVLPEKYVEFPDGVMQPGGVDVTDTDIVIAVKSEPIPITSRSLSDGASSYQRSLSTSDSLTRPRSLETENNLNSDHTPKAEKGSSSLDSVSDEESIRRHRHSIPGHLSSYLTFLAGLQQKAAAAAAAAVPVFSTAVISGSTSAPDLRDNFSALPFSANLEGLGGVPSIRPLETLHNALSLRQLDAFLERMALAQFRTPLSSPPKMPSTPRHPRSQPPPLGLQSPSSSIGWSGPPSFVSSSGPSSPNINTLEFFSHLHRYDTYMPPPSPQFLTPITSLTTTVAPTNLNTAISDHTLNHPFITKLNSAAANYVATTAISAKSAAAVPLTHVAADAAASRLILELTNSTTPGYTQERLGLASEHSSVAELNTGVAEMGTSEDLSGDASEPGSPSEGSESLGSPSQTEVASIIERGDTATPDTHSDVQDQDISYSETSEPDNNFLHVANTRSATSD